MSRYFFTTMNESDTLEDIYPTAMSVPTDKDISLPSGSADPKPEPVDSEIEVFDRIANKLLRSGLLLTALELHAELIERGKELPRLREFFDNPHNFEKHLESQLPPSKAEVYSLFRKNSQPKSPSEQTFDSLDFTHYSDDDIEHHGDERIAVLEFELRKARQTIDSLRASLTQSTTGQLYEDFSESIKSVQSSSKPSVNKPTTEFDPFSTRDFYGRGSADGDSCPGDEDKFANPDPLNLFEGPPSGEKHSLATLIKPHEKRALNYLINEYLMENNYRITSITFCDQNTEQDFDKWDDVGLNISRPPDLLKLYRFYWQNCASLIRTNSIATTSSTLVPHSATDEDNQSWSEHCKYV